MNDIKSIIAGGYTPPEIKTDGPNSPIAEIIEQVAFFMDGHLERFGYWIGRTKPLSPGAIHTILKAAQEGQKIRRPRALFEDKLQKEQKRLRRLEFEKLNVEQKPVTPVGAPLMLPL